jgi:hypothetical protein
MSLAGNGLRSREKPGPTLDRLLSKTHLPYFCGKPVQTGLDIGPISAILTWMRSVLFRKSHLGNSALTLDGPVVCWELILRHKSNQSSEAGAVANGRQSED